MSASGPSGPLVLSYTGPERGHLCHADTFLDENNVDQDQLASQKPADQDLHCFHFTF